VKLPRNLTGRQLIVALGRIGYRVTRQSGSHVRLTFDGDPQHHLTVPAHDPLRIGTLASILDDIAQARDLDKQLLLRQLFD
jgi:predicted RNA binding protein YcfA (HicA-like mRNA interferase family)